MSRKERELEIVGKGWMLTSAGVWSWTRRRVCCADIYDVKNTAEDSEHRHCEWNNFELIEYHWLKWLLSHAQNEEEDEQHEDYQSLCDDTILDKVHLDEDENDLPVHDNNFPEVKLLLVASE